MRGFGGGRRILLLRVGIRLLVRIRILLGVGLCAGLFPGLLPLALCRLFLCVLGCGHGVGLRHSGLRHGLRHSRLVVVRLGRNSGVLPVRRRGRLIILLRQSRGKQDKERGEGDEGFHYRLCPSGTGAWVGACGGASASGLAGCWIGCGLGVPGLPNSSFRLRLART